MCEKDRSEQSAVGSEQWLCELLKRMEQGWFYTVDEIAGLMGLSNYPKSQLCTQLRGLCGKRFGGVVFSEVPSRRKICFVAEEVGSSDEGPVVGSVMYYRS